MLRKTISRFWPLWVGYLLVLLMALPMGLYNDLQYDDFVTVADIQQYIYNITQAGVGFAFVMSPIAAMCVFSHLYNDRSAGAYASLPVKREAMFLSCTLAGLIPQLLAGILATLGAVGVESSFGLVDITSALTFLGIFCLHTLTFYGFAVLCAQLTGATLVLPAVYVVLQFTGVVVQSLLLSLFDVFLYGYASSSLNLQFLSPLIEIITKITYGAADYGAANGVHIVTSYLFAGWGTAIAYAVSGLACLVISFFLYRKRRMESAGDFVSMQKLKPVFKWALGMGCGLVLTWFILSLFHNFRTDLVLGIPAAPAALLSLLIGCFVGYFAAEMMMKKTFRVFRGKIWRGFAVCAAVLLVLLSSLVFDFFGYETRMPREEKVTAAMVFTQGDEAMLQSADGIEAVLHAHKGVIATRKENLDTRKKDWNDQSYTSHYFTITYLLENGKTLERHYNLSGTGNMLPVLREIEDIMNGSEALASRIPQAEALTPAQFRHGNVYYNMESRPLTQDDAPMPTVRSENVSLSAKEAYDLYVNCILPDAMENTTGTVCFTEDSPYFKPQYAVNIEFGIYRDKTDEYGRDSSYFTFCPTTESHRTNAWLEEHGVTMVLQTEIDDIYAAQAQWEKYGIDMNPNSAEGATSVAIIGGADGPTSIVVTR